MELIRPRSISPQWKKSAPSLRSPGAFHPSDSRRDGLPSIGYLDIEKIKREASDQTSKHSSTPSLTMPAPSILSPSTIYSGPPPPYSYPSSATSPVGGVASYISPPESRRTSDDDKGPPPPLQSLPSIHEALGKEPPMMAAARPSAAPPPPMPPPLLSLPNSTIAAPRSHPEAVLPGPPNPYASGPPAAYPYEMHERRPPPMYGSPPHGDEAAALAARFAAADHSAHLAHAASAAVHLSSPVHPHAPSMPQPPHQVPPGYSPRAHAHATLASQSSYPRPPYSYPPQPPAIPYARPFVAVHPPLRRPDQTEIGRADEVRKAAAIRSPTAGQHYGESVKRHLDLFELETSLNEVNGRFRMGSNGTPLTLVLDCRRQRPQLGIHATLRRQSSSTPAIRAAGQSHAADPDGVRRHDPAAKPDDGRHQPDQRRHHRPTDRPGGTTEPGRRQQAAERLRRRRLLLRAQGRWRRLCRGRCQEETRCTSSTALSPTTTPPLTGQVEKCATGPMS